MAPANQSPSADAPSAVTATVVDTAMGPVGLACTDRAVVAVQLPERDEATTRRHLLAKLSQRDHAGGAAVAVAEMDEAELTGTAAHAAEVIRMLLAGDDADITAVPVDLNHCPEFNRRVYTEARTIPRGHTRTYGQVAEAVGEPGGAQAVGRAMATNPVPILVPCHRVLGANRTLTGFSAHGGVDTKRRILLIEGSTDVAPTLFDQLDPVGRTGQPHEPDQPDAR